MLITYIYVEGDIKNVKIIEIIKGKGHPNIRATHKSTLEITKDPYLTPRGDCIIIVNADKAAIDLSEETKRALRSGRKIRILIEFEGLCDEIVGRGHPNLPLTDQRSIVIRKSTYICPRTVLIKSNKAARDLNRQLIEKLREEYWKEVTVKFYII